MVVIINLMLWRRRIHRTRSTTAGRNVVKDRNQFTKCRSLSLLGVHLYILIYQFKYNQDNTVLEYCDQRIIWRNPVFSMGWLRSVWTEPLWCVSYRCFCVIEEHPFIQAPATYALAAILSSSGVWILFCIKFWWTLYNAASEHTSVDRGATGDLWSADYVLPLQ